jgi:hypothetical protein
MILGFHSGDRQRSLFCGIMLCSPLEVIRHFGGSKNKPSKKQGEEGLIVFIVCSVHYFVRCVLFECGVLFCVMCVTAVPLPPGKKPIAAKINNKKNQINPFINSS